MTVINLLSSSKGESGSNADIVLARQIASLEDHEAIKELIDNLKNIDRRIRSDCIKVLYETAYIKPGMIAGYYTDFIQLLQSKNNRLVWGSMIAIATITELKAKEIFGSLDIIMETIEKGSVITVDCGVEILSRLNKHNEYFNTTDPLLIDQLWKCPIKQLPSYAEKAAVSINKLNKEAYQNIIEKRKPECDKESQLKRLEKVLKYINGI